MDPPEDNPLINKEYAFIYKTTKKSLNKKDLKLLYRHKMLENLRSRSPYPDLVNIEDVKCDDPLLFNRLKGLYKSVPVLGRWKSKHLFPLNYKKKEYFIPPSIVDTGLDLLRYNLIQMKKTETDKEKFMNKIFPKIGKIGINPEKLYKAFTGSNSCNLFDYGEAFDFTWETEKKRFVPGILTTELKNALGMTEFSPVPWLFKMQKIGPPANIQIPGVNAEIPPGCFYGYEPNGWGKPCFTPKDKEEYIYNLENQYTALKEKKNNKEEDDKLNNTEKVEEKSIIIEKEEKAEEKSKFTEKEEKSNVTDKEEESNVNDKKAEEKPTGDREIKEDEKVEKDDSKKSSIPKRKKNPKSKLRSKF